LAKYYDRILTLTAGTLYYMPKTSMFKVEKIGTNSAGTATLNIKTAKLGGIKSLVAPLHKTSSNLLGPMDLENLYYIIPRESDFHFDGDSGSKMVLIGKWIMLDKPEEIPKELTERGLTQFREYKTYVESTVSLGTNVALPANGEVELLSLTPKSIETYTFDDVVMFSVENYTPAEGDLALRFFLDTMYLDEILDLPGTDRKGGVDVMWCRRPPADSTEKEPFTLRSSPIVLKGPHTLKVYLRNVKGANIAPAAGTSLTFTLTMITKYKTEESK
jgi:hypothetical protein